MTIDPILGQRAIHSVEFRFERLAEPIRLLLVNADESGSMENRMDRNVAGLEALAKHVGGADLVILHSFESDSHYELFCAPRARRLPLERLASFPRLSQVAVASPADALARARQALVRHTARGTTNPRSHAAFLKALSGVLTGDADVELLVLSSSDGGFDGGPDSPAARGIHDAMQLVVARCRCVLAMNLLVGSAGSPEALGFFTGDPDRFETRLLVSTEHRDEHIWLLDPSEPRWADIPPLGRGGDDVFTLSPPLPVWRVEGERLFAWAPLGPTPSTVVVRRSRQIAGRRQIERAEVSLAFAPVTLDRDGALVFDAIARSLSDNPFLRESSREALNELIAPLEALLGTREEVLARLAVRPDDQAAIDRLQAEVDANTAEVRAALTGEAAMGTPRARSAALNELNARRRQLKQALRHRVEQGAQHALDFELGFCESHPDHWLAWLQPAIDALKAQLVQTQADPGNVLAHLSTRIRSAKSAADGQQRAADRYLDKLLAQSRQRRDQRERAASSNDKLPFERPGQWLDEACPIGGGSLAEGIAAIPFVADRRDLTSGSMMAGGQAVDRIPIDRGPMLSLDTARDLMWGANGQMASPFLTPRGLYNAAIPVLIGPASPAALRDLERAIGWLCTGTTAFAPPMAEAVPGALVALLGHDEALADHSPHVQALLRTTPLLHHFPSYPYAPGTSVFDESSPKLPLTEVWAQSVAGAHGAACLQTMGCSTSLFARALAADRVDARAVALDLFSWGCRNVGRSLLTGAGEVGATGVEGVMRLAALLDVLVDLEGCGPTHPPAPAAPHEPLGRDGLEQLLGSAASIFDGRPPPTLADFTDHLDAALREAPAELCGEVLSRLDDLLRRVDAWLASSEVRAAPPDALGVEHTGARHAGFGSDSLDALVPTRVSTAPPVIASPFARARRRTYEGVTRWWPPTNAMVAPTLDTDGWRYLDGHSAFAPLRAWLRLWDARLVGRPALLALRASAAVQPIPAVGSVMARVARLVGVSELRRMARRALAFVVQNANGYADSQWATHTMRQASDQLLDEVLDVTPLAPVAHARRYTANDSFLVDPLEPGWDPTPWPQMDRWGYLPKSAVVDHAGRRVRAVQLDGETRTLTDDEVCHQGFVRLAQLLPPTRFGATGGLHRHARALLRRHPHDLRALPPSALAHAIQVELAPVLAGRVRGDLQNPGFFFAIHSVLYQYARLGIDTRTLQAQEPRTWVAAEATTLRGSS